MKTEVLLKNWGSALDGHQKYNRAMPPSFRQKSMHSKVFLWSGIQCMAWKLTRKSNFDLHDSFIVSRSPASATSKQKVVSSDLMASVVPLSVETSLSADFLPSEYCRRQKSIMSGDTSVPIIRLGMDGILKPQEEQWSNKFNDKIIVEKRCKPLTLNKIELLKEKKIHSSAH